MLEARGFYINHQQMKAKAEEEKEAKKVTRKPKFNLIQVGS